MVVNSKKIRRLMREHASVSAQFRFLADREQVDAHGLENYLFFAVDPLRSSPISRRSAMSLRPIVARVIEGMSIEETSELLGIRPETVKTRLHRDQDVPGTVARGGRMCDEVGIDPLDGVADVGRNFGRHKGELFHLHLNGVGARHARRNNENERAEYLRHVERVTALGPI